MCLNDVAQKKFEVQNFKNLSKFNKFFMDIQNYGHWTPKRYQVLHVEETVEMGEMEEMEVLLGHY